MEPLCFVLAASAWIAIAIVARRIRRLESNVPLDRAAAPDRIVPAPSATRPALTPLASDSSTAPQAPPPPPLPDARGAARVRDARPKRDLERFLGRRVLLVAGVVGILLGVGFFLHHAIRAGALGPGARTVLTAAAGIAAIAAAERLRRRGLDAYASGLSGAGVGALYLAVHFGANVHGFFPPSLGFALAAAITAATALVGIRRESPFLTHLGFLGAWLAPALFGRDASSVWPLTIWLLVVDAGVLLVRLRRPYAGLDLLAAVATSAYIGGFVLAMDAGEAIAPAAAAWIALSLSRIAIAVAPVLVPRRDVAWKALFAAILSATTMAGIGRLLLDDHPTGLGFALAGFAVAYLVAARFSVARACGPRASHGFAAVGLASLAAAIPLLLHGAAAAIGFSACGATLLAVAARSSRSTPLWFGLAYLVLALNAALRHHFPLHDEPFRLFANPAFATHASVLLAWLLGGLAIRSRRPVLSRALTALATVSSCVLLAAEIGAFVDLNRTGMSPWTARDPELFAAVSLAVLGLAAQVLWRPRDAVAACAGTAAAALSLIPGALVATRGYTGGELPFANPACATGIALAALLAASARHLLARPREAGSPDLRRLGWTVASLAAVWLILVTTLDLRHLGRAGRLFDLTRAELSFLAQVGISTLWAFYAAVLTLLGFARSRPRLRWAGMALFALAAVKVFVFDLAHLAAAWRAGSLLGLGLLLLAASYLYHRNGSGGPTTGALRTRPS